VFVLAITVITGLGKELYDLCECLNIRELIIDVIGVQNIGAFRPFEYHISRPLPETCLLTHFQFKLPTPPSTLPYLTTKGRV